MEASRLASAVRVTGSHALEQARAAARLLVQARRLGDPKPLDPACDYYATTAQTQDKQLLCGHGGYTGPIPAELGDFTWLTYVSVKVNKLVGTIPGTLAKLTDLEKFYVHSNKFTGTLPASLAKLTRLTSLNLFGNQLNGTIPAELGRLEYIDLHHNAMSGTIPAGPP